LRGPAVLLSAGARVRHPGVMSRRGIVDVLVYVGLTVLVLVSLLAALLTWLNVLGVAWEPTRAVELWDASDVVIVENQLFWPSVTVAGETAPGVVETVTVAARWWLVSPLLMIGLAFVLVRWRESRARAALTPELDDTQPIPTSA
jgi:hypothetical protein